jgi:biopolymer transport protein ExbB
MGGWTLYTLLIFSIVSVTIIVFKIFEFKKKGRIDPKSFLKIIKKKIHDEPVSFAVLYCDKINTPVSYVGKAGVAKYADTSSTNVEETMNREVLIETIKLEKYTTIVGTIGSIAVYIGLFGTVLGIIRSFHDISKVGSGGISVVIGGVSEALIATAAGLCVAIPAVAAYNFFMKRIDNFVVEMEYAVSALEELLKTGIQK